MRLPKIVLAIAAALCLTPAYAQQNALLSMNDAAALFDRAVQLMESTSVTVPELARAGAPLAENARQALVTMKATDVRNPTLVYTFLTNARAYLTLTDMVPKPYPLPEQAHGQFLELRDAVERAEVHFRALIDSKEKQIKNPDRDNLARYAEANTKLAGPQAGRPRVILFGDSITDFWRLHEYFADRDFVNRGISGQITGEMLGRMKADVIDLKPSCMLILAGTNDIARGVAVKTIENNLQMIADVATANGIRPIFASLLPISDYNRKPSATGPMQRERRPPATIRAINQWLQGFCKQRGYTYVDYYSRLADASGFLMADASDDGLHPNAKGYRLMAPLALEAIDKELKGSSKQTPKKRKFPF
ncbi:MAG: GDSL-type esterase/lipase family protein [Bryobacteraceae bacterium]